MALADFFDHTCDIYHLQKQEKTLDYGIDDIIYGYGEFPDESAVPCHFYIKTLEEFSHTVPAPVVSGRMKLAIGSGTDIRVNDKIVNNVTGVEYICEIVHDIRGHHLMAYLFREDERKLPEVVR